MVNLAVRGLLRGFSREGDKNNEKSFVRYSYLL